MRETKSWNLKEGKRLMQQGFNTEAIMHFKRSMKDERDTKALRLIMECYERDGKFTMAVETAELLVIAARANLKPEAKRAKNS